MYAPINIHTVCYIVVINHNSLNYAKILLA